MSHPAYNLTAVDVAARYGVSTKTVRRWADTGKIRHVVLPSGQRRFSAADLDDLRVVEPTTAA